ncbi:MAG TPA: LysR substrate-binding domain-containing protein [Polyangia bacterium]|jgi:hypothetical protein|nr:LysR substrate-binding domain-containing protein [Polyangia bacterium]
MCASGAPFAAFTRAHPRIHVEPVVTSRRVNLVEDNVDLALRAGQLDDSSLVARKVGVDHIGLYAAPSSLERRTFSSLAAHEAVVRVLPAYGLRGEPFHLVPVPLRHVPVRVKLLREFLLREIPRRLAGTPCAVDERPPERARRRETPEPPRRDASVSKARSQSTL